MAKKKAARSKPQASPVMSRVQSGITKMQRDAEALLSRARKEAVRMSHEQKRTLNRVVTEAQRFRNELENSAKRTAKNLESGSKRFLTTLEKNAQKRLEPVVKRFFGRNLASRQEIQSLAQRVRELEHLVKQHSHPEAPVAPAQPSLSSPGPPRSSMGE